MNVLALSTLETLWFEAQDMCGESGHSESCPAILVICERP